MTPWQCKILYEADAANRERQHDQAAWAMWHGALLSQPLKKRPPLADFLVSPTQKKPVKMIDETAIKARLQAYNRRVQGG